MELIKEYSKKWKKNYWKVTIPKEEVEGLQGDLTITIPIERDKDSLVPSIGWKMKINDKEYGDFIEAYVNENFTSK